MTDAPPLFRLRGISRRFTTTGGVLALDGISLDIHHGEMIAITGASGSGKSTLMNILGCLDRPSGGQCLIDGHDTGAMGPDELAALRNRLFGFIFQRYNLLPDATAAENVELPALYAGAPARWRRTRAAELLARLGLGDRLHHRPSELSGGQQQRVSIARALVNDARVILADEPTGALDAASGEDVLRQLEELNRDGRTIIIVTHDPQVAARARRRIHIADGKVVADEVSSADLSSHPPSRPTTPTPDADPVAHHGHRRLDMFAAAARTALRSLRRDPFRTLLTLVGVMIGVASVIAMLAVGEGGREATLARLEKMGTNLLIVRPGAPGVRSAADLTSLTIDDVQAIRDIEGLTAVSPVRTLRTTLRAGAIDYVTTVHAAWPDIAVVRNWRAVAGGFISAEDVAEYRAVVVLGRTVARNLFPDTPDPTGRLLVIRNMPFQVIGILNTRGADQWGNDHDDLALIPLSAGFMRILGKPYLNSVMVKVDHAEGMTAAAADIDQLMMARHGIRNFQITDSAAAQQALSESQRSFAMLLGAVAAISLLVGGIGVMNIMLVGVTERTREIGIRMATGARRRDVLTQFNVEAVVVCGLGGIIGVALGTGAALILARNGFDVVIRPGPAVAAFGCAFLTGVIFGWLPARKAAGMDPVSALAAE
ncbi:MacB family efflux pump subunit [Tistrella mobilis]|uniref:MacB family efflux pump subunit n=1 Tax=Tistrella mobilis TaxID=171437 RepID=UPI000C0B4C60|nr:MacB family efflux pump subunit [uncultured Tistrella sp.]MAM75164.1 macrolide ABC transporter permease/ATP-binding protein MacB [Tistrella sp.]